MHFKYLRVPFFLNIKFYPFLWCMYGCGPLLLGPSCPSAGTPTHTSAFKTPQWAPQTTAEVRKKGIYCISAIYTYELLLKRVAGHDLKTWHYYSWVLVAISQWQRTKHGQECFAPFEVQPGAAFIRTLLSSVRTISPRSSNIFGDEQPKQAWRS